MGILVINAGSTTIKFKYFTNELAESLSGVIDKKDNSYEFSLKKNDEKYEWEITAEEFAQAGKLILKELKTEKVDKIGFRIVHGGEKYSRPTLLDADTLSELEQYNELAPLHNPFALARIHEFNILLPDVPKYGVFDTAFHGTIPAKAFLYAIPYEFYEDYGVRRFGFHGISHNYISEELKKLEPTAKKVISCHLGGGASVTAILNGHSVETSMGFTPLEGLIMATRPGDIDDGAIHYLMGKMHMSVKDMQEIENKHSGLLGISGKTGDMRKILEMEKTGEARAHLAVEMYIHRVAKYIGSYAAIMEGIDALVFTAGVGAGSDELRRRICEKLTFMGFEVDNDINSGKINVSENLKISSSNSKTIWVIPTNEELQIATGIHLL